MARTPDGHGKLELTRYHHPAAIGDGPQNPPPDTLGLQRVMLAVDDIDDTIARLRLHGARLIGEVARYKDIYRLCCLRGPPGIILALAERTNSSREFAERRAAPDGRRRPGRPDSVPGGTRYATLPRRNTSSSSAKPGAAATK